MHQDAPPPLPTTLDEATDYIFPYFDGMKYYTDKYSEDDFVSFCHSQLSGGIGMKIRNRLQLWVHESPLHQYFPAQHNLFHPDEMSAMIIRKVYQRLKNATNPTE